MATLSLAVEFKQIVTLFNSNNNLFTIFSPNIVNYDIMDQIFINFT